jgi:thymine-DNA glycosylase
MLIRDQKLATDRSKNVTKFIEGSKFPDGIVNHSTEDGSASPPMMKNGFDVTAKDLDKKALLWAAGKRHEAVAQLLLEKGPDVETTEDQSFLEERPAMPHPPDGASGSPLPPQVAEVAVSHAFPSVEMPEGAQPSLQTLSLKGGLERFGFTKSPLKLSNGVHTDSSSSEQPASLLKRKSTDGVSTVSPNAKRITRLNPKPLAETSPPPPSQSSWRSRRRSPRKEKHTSQEKYASHPNNLTDSISPNLHLLFIGTNPGLTAALTGHAYAHPTNHFWRLLHSSGITPILHKPSDTDRLPALYNLGNTNIVSRATKNASELSKEEMNAGVAILEQKISEKKPEAVCLVGKSIWEAIWRVKKGRNITKEEFKYGWQAETDNMGIVKGPDGWRGARVFVGTTTSGLAATMSKEEKERVWRELGVWVEKKRKEDEERKGEE